MFLLLPSSEPLLFNRPFGANYHARKSSQLRLGVREAQAEVLFCTRPCLCAGPHKQLHRGRAMLEGVLSHCPLRGSEDRVPFCPIPRSAQHPKRSQATGMFHVLPRGSTEHLGQKVPSSSPPTTVFPALTWGHPLGGSPTPGLCPHSCFTIPHPLRGTNLATW